MNVEIYSDWISPSLWTFFLSCNIFTSCPQLDWAIDSVSGEMLFTATVSSLQTLRTFNKIACEETGREMTDTPVDTACHCGLAKFISNAEGFELGFGSLRKIKLRVK